MINLDVLGPIDPTPPPFLDPKYFEPQIFLVPKFFGLNFGTQICFGPNILLFFTTRIFFWTQNVFGPKIFLALNFFEP